MKQSILKSSDSELMINSISISASDLQTIAQHAKLLDSLVFNTFNLTVEESVQTWPTPEFRFLTTLKLNNIVMETIPQRLHEEPAVQLSRC